MKKFLFNDYAVWKNEICYFDPITSLPSKIDIETGKITYIEHLENYYKENTKSIDIMECHNGVLYALNMAGDDLIICDIEKKVCKHVPMHYTEKAGENFVYIYGINDGVYIFPRYKSEIIFVDEVGNARRIPYNKNGLGEIICGCTIGRRIYLFPKQGNKYILFDIETEECKLVSIKMELRKVTSCTDNAEKIYILDRERNIYILDTQRETIKCLEYKCSYKEGETVERVLFAANKLFVFPALAEDIQILDLQTNEVKKYSKYPDDFLYYPDIAWSKYYGCTEDDRFYYLLRKSNYMLSINKDTGEFKWLMLSAPEEIEEMRVQLDYGKMDFYEKYNSLNSYVDSILQFEGRQAEKIINTGKIIWEEVLGE